MQTKTSKHKSVTKGKATGLKEERKTLRSIGIVKLRVSNHQSVSRLDYLSSDLIKERCLDSCLLDPSVTQVLHSFIDHKHSQRYVAGKRATRALEQVNFRPGKKPHR